MDNQYIEDDADTLPATIETAVAVLPEKKTGVPGITERHFAADSIRAPLPAVVYERIGTVQLTAEENQILDAPTSPDEADVRPDGLVYVSHEYVRRQLNAALGRMGWTFVPVSPLTQEPGTQRYYQRWALFIRGVYASEALGSREYFKDRNAAMSLDDVAESVKSDTLRRCGKDLGIATEPWNRRWSENWRRENAVQVEVQKRWKDGSMHRESAWRRKDADPLQGEISKQISAGATGIVAPSSTPAASPQPRTAPAEPKLAVKRDPPKTSASAKPATPPPVATAPEPTPPDAVAVRAETAPPETASAAQPPKGAPIPKPVLDNYIRQTFALARTKGLMTGDDASALMDWLASDGVCGDAPGTPGKTSAENAHAMLSRVETVKAFAELIKRIRAVESPVA